jgi:hypothetical protein
MLLKCVPYVNAVDAVTNSDYMISVEWWADRFIINNGSERMREEAVEAYLRYFPGICLDG